ncbi:hypothetical protein F4861DRAFT_524667 [Xylaria intraflava]|nr:hypothetical protein F4861DRAFT_524667 [Xylaria intraflava]
MVGYIRTAIVVVAALGYGTAFATTGNRFEVAHPAHNPRADSDVTPPFLVTIKSTQTVPNNTALSGKPQNISAYLLGKVPVPTNPTNLLEFIAQHADDGSTSYYMPPSDTLVGATITSAVPNLSWKVNTDSNGTSFKAPGTIISGRIYIVDGSLNFSAGPNGGIVEPDPHNPSDISSQQLWGFIELTYSNDSSNGHEGLTVNLSFVDWVSLPLGIELSTYEANQTITAVIPGLNPDGLVKICNELSQMDGFWPKLCLRSADNKPLRVMSPQKYVSLYADDHDAINYYEPYIDQVWSKYKTVDLQINTQVDNPDSNSKVANGVIVTCRVGASDNILHCDNNAGDFERPVSRDIWGCNSGPFANPSQGTESWSRARLRPRLCAAFTRSTLHLDYAQPSLDIGPERYYGENITNHYARLVHENLMGGMGYAFSYDDVNPDAHSNSGGLMSTPHPIELTVLINA